LLFGAKKTSETATCPMWQVLEDWKKKWLVSMNISKTIMHFSLPIFLKNTLRIYKQILFLDNRNLNLGKSTSDLTKD